MASANENAFTRSNQEQFLDKNIFCPQSSYFTKSDSPDFISAYFIYYQQNKLYIFYNRVFDTAQADFPYRDGI